MVHLQRKSEIVAIVAELKSESGLLWIENGRIRQRHEKSKG
jgi:hypothetical protein